MIPDIERRKLLIERTSQLIKLREHLESLTEAGRGFWSGGLYNAEDHFETELVRAEDFLKEIGRNANL